MSCINFLLKAFCLSLVFVAITSRPVSGPNRPLTRLSVQVSAGPQVFNVLSYGAKGDGKTDNAIAFTNAWKDACAWNGTSQVYIPKQTFYLGGVTFEGPCNGEISFSIDGTLLAPPNSKDIKMGTIKSWILFRKINNLTVNGNGTIDGQGKDFWTRYSNGGTLAMSMAFISVNTSRIEGITSVNSKTTHLSFSRVNDFNITGVNIVAPDDSPNTDGIKLSFSSNIIISNAQIGTGDDCIAILSGNTNVDIYNIKCGPGHGISVGSLGKYKNEKNVDGLTVRDSVINGTVNGIRIKSWEFSASEIVASNFSYENIQMIDVKYPINIDQQYCPTSKSCSKKGNANVQIENITFKSIRGTATQKDVVTLNCSQSVPCKHIELSDIDLTYNGPDGPATTICENVDGKANGIC